MRILCYLSIALFSIIFMASPKTNPLSDTSWKGLMNIPNPTDANLKFSADTMYVYADSTLIESSSYSVKSDTLTITKIIGFSPCADEIGIYTFQIHNDILSVQLVSDICEARSYAFTPLGFKKEE